LERKDWPFAFALLLHPVRERKEARTPERDEAFGRSCVAVKPNERGPTCNTFLSLCRGRNLFILIGALIPTDLMRRFLFLFLFCRSKW
jgi:hypothetical protein